MAAAGWVGWGGAASAVGWAASKGAATDPGMVAAAASWEAWWEYPVRKVAAATAAAAAVS